jgi:hypothetical protein
MSDRIARVTEARIDRESWATMVQSLIMVHSGGNLERFARTVGINARTIRRWLDRQVDVSFDNVRKVGVATGTSLDALLLSAGYLGPHDDAEHDGSVNAVADEELRLIHAAPIDKDLRQRLLRYVVDRRERDRRARIEDLEFFLDLPRRSVKAG